MKSYFALPLLFGALLIANPVQAQEAPAPVQLEGQPSVAVPESLSQPPAAFSEGQGKAEAQPSDMPELEQLLAVRRAQAVRQRNGGAWLLSLGLLHGAAAIGLFSVDLHALTKG